MASVKEVLEYLLSTDILIKDPNTSAITLSERGYLHLGIPPINQVIKKEPSLNYIDLAERIRNLFPSGIKSGNHYVRSAKQALVNKLKTFSNQYPEYTEEQIVLATSKYVNDLKEKNYQFMQTAQFFILKDGVSNLASYIDNMDAEEQQIKQDQDFRGEVV